jgi:hypothetical protein
VILPRFCIAAVRGRRHQLPPSFPRSPGIISAVLSKGFSGLRAATAEFVSDPILDASSLRFDSFSVRQTKLSLLFNFRFQGLDESIFLQKSGLEFFGSLTQFGWSPINFIQSSFHHSHLQRKS